MTEHSGLTGDEAGLTGLGPGSRQRWRTILAVLLIVLGCVLAPLAGVAVGARNQVTNTDRYVRTVAPLAAVHPNVVSQCDNLVLMPMSSSADLAYLAEAFSQVPGSLLGRAPHFTIGQALIAGRPVQSPTFVTFGGPLSREGGSDIPATWATGPGRESEGA